MSPARETQDRVDSTIPAYDRMAGRWELLHDLLGGTLAMRSAGAKWLPREPAESTEAYDTRLKRSVLYEAFKDAVERLAGKPFEEAISLENVPERLSYLEDDADGAGQSLTELGRNLFEDLATYGLAHVLVDFTRMPQNEGGTRATIADERVAGARAIFARIAPPDLIGWRTVSPPIGPPALEQIRIRERHEVPAGTYLVEETDRIRALSPGGWSLWEMDPQGKDWIQIDEGALTFGSIPLVTIYAERIGFLQADPPLERLAWLNLAHWQSMSDQRNILRFARFALLFLKGLTDEDMEKQLEIGPTQAIRTKSREADGKYLEHSGAAIEAGRKDLEDLERRMEVLGLTPFFPRTAKGVTATVAGIAESRNVSAVQAWIRALEGGLRRCYELAGEWHGVEIPDDSKFDVFSDFEIPMLAGRDLDFLLRSTQAGKLSLETWLSEIKRRAVLSETIDLEEEAERIREQAPGLGDLGGSEPDDLEADEDEAEEDA